MKRLFAIELWLRSMKLYFIMSFTANTSYLESEIECRRGCGPHSVRFATIYQINIIL